MSVLKFRRNSTAVQVGNVLVGGHAPIVVQSMTNTDTADIQKTVAQVSALATAGSEIVRITVNNKEAAQAVPSIREQLNKKGIDVPLVGDFHFNGGRLLSNHPDCAKSLAKFRINPGNVGHNGKQFTEIVEIACKLNKPIRIGVNWGSLDQVLLAKLFCLLYTSDAADE